MNHYAKAIKALSGSLDYRAIAFNLAAKHPGIFLKMLEELNPVLVECTRLVQAGEKVQAIKLYRESNPGCGLKEAVDVINEL